MKHEVPLVYDTLFYVIDEAVKISFGTYEVATNLTVLKRTISRIMRMRIFWGKKTESLIIESTKVAEHALIYGRKIYNLIHNYINSDVDEAKSLYQKFTLKSDISELKAKKKKMEEKKKLIMSDGSYERFHAIKAKRRLQDMSASPMQSYRSSRNIYASLYNKHTMKTSRNSVNRSMSMEPEKYKICEEEDEEDVEEEKETEDEKNGNTSTGNYGLGLAVKREHESHDNVLRNFSSKTSLVS